MASNKNTNFPVQKLPLSKKDKEWKEACVDSLIAREAGFSVRHSKMKISYDLMNSVFDEKDLKYVVNPYKVEDGFPATIQNINIIRPKIELLIGEESKRPSNLLVFQVGESAVLDLQEEQKKLMYDALENHIMLGAENKSEEEMQKLNERLSEIQDYVKSKYYNSSERTAYDSLRYLKEHLNLSDEFLKGWEDGLTSGEEIYYGGVVNGEPIGERVNPITLSYDRDPDLKNIEDGEWAVRRMQMTPSAVYDRFYDIMEEKDLDKLLQEVNAQQGSSIPTGMGDAINTNYIVYKDLNSFFVGNEEEFSGGLMLPVWHAVWKSFKKVGFLTTIDENGEVISTIVDETYKKDENEQIEWDWIIEVWEGYRIGDSLYLGIKPLEYQYTSIDNPNSKKLPYIGIVYNNNNSPGKSLVEIMKPLQYMYLIVFYRLELTLARDKGKVLLMDMTQIPKSQGIDVMQWMHYLSSMGVAFVNPYDEGWDIPGREGGRPASFNQITDIDLTMGNVIREYIELLNKIEEMIGELSGVSKARQGQIHQSSLVGNVRQEITQSSHITEPLFWKHNQVKKNFYNYLLNVAKYAWRVSNVKKLNFILPGPERIILNIEDDFLYSDHGVFITDSTKENANLESLKSLTQAAMQNGASLLDIADIMTSESMSEIRQKLEKTEIKKKMLEQQALKVQEQASKDKSALKERELEIQEEDSIRKANTELQVAQIRANTDNNDLDFEKMDLQRRKQESSSKLDERKQTEVERHNKAQETISKINKNSNNKK